MGDKKMTESPGIVYDSHLINTAINKRNHAFTFSKKSRDLSFKAAKKSLRAQQPSPGQYQEVEMNQFKIQAPRGKFSMAPRNVDFSSFNSKEMLYGGFKLE